MGMSNFSVFTKFLAKDGISPVFKNMTNSSKTFNNKTNSGILKTKDSLLSLKTALKGVMVTMTAVATAVPVKTFADWQKGINNVYGLMSQDEINKYGKTIEELSRKAIRCGVSIENANTALFDTISAMGVSQMSFDTYNQALILAKGGNTDLSTAISGLTAIINAFGESNTNAVSAANAMFTAQKYGVTTVQELADNIGSIAPTARAAGVSMEETLATMAALTKGGMATANATTSLTAVLGAFIKPTDQAKKVLQKYGVASDLVELRQQGLGLTMSKLIKLQKEHPAEIARAVPKLKALTGVLAMNEERLQDVDKILKQVQIDIKSGTGLKEAFERMSSGDASVMANTMGALNIAMIQVGQLISPILMPLVKGFGDLVFLISEMIPKLEPVVNFVIKLADGFKSSLKYLKPLQALLPIVSGMISGLAFYKAVQFFQILRLQTALFSMTLKNQLIPQLLKTIPVIWSQTAALLANPLVWIPAVIAGVVTALVLLWKNWDKVTATITSWWNSTKTFLAAFWKACKEVFGKVGAFIKDNFLSIVLTCLGPVGFVISSLMKLPSIIKQIKKGGGIKIEGVDGKDIQQKQPKVKGNKNGSIEVKTTIDNRTGYNAQTSTSLQSPNNLSLKPA